MRSAKRGRESKLGYLLQVDGFSLHGFLYKPCINTKGREEWKVIFNCHTKGQNQGWEEKGREGEKGRKQGHGWLVKKSEVHDQVNGGRKKGEGRKLRSWTNSRSIHEVSTKKRSLDSRYGTFSLKSSSPKRSFKDVLLGNQKSG